MRRTLALVVGTVLAFAAVSAGPANPVQPAPGPSTAPARFRTCLARADRGSTPVLAISSAAPGPVAVSATAAGSLEPVTTSPIGAAGGGVVALGDAGLVGFATLLAEMPTDATAAAVITRGERGRAAQACAGRPEPVVAVSGGSSLEGERPTLVLGNPFATDAVVAVTSASEVGEDSAGELSSLLVPARSTVTVDLGRLLPLREHLSVVLTAERGAVVGGLVQAGDGDVAAGTFVPPAGDWWLALPDVGQQSATLSFISLAPTDVEYQVDTYQAGQVTEGMETGSVAPGEQVVVDLSEVVPPAGVRVTATGPVVASLSLTGEHLRALSAGVPAPSDRWFVPGAGVGGPSVLWVFNPGATDLDAVFQPLSPGAQARREPLPAASVTAVPVGGGSRGGYLVEAVGDVVVMWTFGGEGPAGFGPGFPADG